MDVRQRLVMIGASLPTIGLIVINDHEPRTEDKKLNVQKRKVWIGYSL